MEALAEQLVATYLTRGGKVFIAPQYAIPNPSGGGDWACPDFVALDFGVHEVVVVEVATGSNVSSIMKKAENREKLWFAPIHEKLRHDGVADGWPIRFLGFVRKNSLVTAERRFEGDPDVTFEAIEKATFSWDYWDERVSRGLPNSMADPTSPT